MNEYFPLFLRVIKPQKIYEYGTGYYGNVKLYNETELNPSITRTSFQSHYYLL